MKFPIVFSQTCVRGSLIYPSGFQALHRQIVVAYLALHSASFDAFEWAEPVNQAWPFSDLLLVAVGQDPVLLLRVKQQAQDVEVEPIFLIGATFIWADQQTALHLGICQ